MNRQRRLELRNYALAGAATLALLCMMTIQAFAQDGYGESGPQYSTPAEHAATEQLNAQQSNGSMASPEYLNGEAPPPPAEADASGYPKGERWRAYEAQQDQYQHDLAVYRHEHAQYMRNLHAYDRDEWAYDDYPERVRYRYDDHDVKKLYLLAEPSQQLSQRPIEGPGGEWVGKVRNVEIGFDGRPRRLEVALNRRVSVWVRAERFRYDTHDGVLFTNLTREDLWDFPGATVESGTY